ncbi:hypothetical protein FRC01_012651 [Tulasnella sp. 417]|nr:hypothetical protein FRC01_012651 [Tulasnella sp. 417]
MRRVNLSSLALFLPYLLLLSALPVTRGLAAPSPASRSLTLPHRRADPDPQQCGFNGDDNIYGLGIRLGLYLLWLSAVLCNFLGPSKADEAKSVKDANLIFQASVLGGLLYITLTHGRSLQDGELYASEVCIMIYLCLGASFLFGPEPEEGAYIIHDVFQQAMTLALMSYSIWFSFTGVDQMKDPQCIRWGLFWGTNPRIRTIWQVSAVFIALLLTLILCYCLVRPCYPRIKDRLPTRIKNRLPSRMRDRLPRAEISDFMPKQLTPIIQSAGLASLVLTVELSIWFLRIHNVNMIGGTGQLIPLIASSLGFTRIIFKLIIERRSRGSRQSTNSAPLKGSDSPH